MLWCFHIPLPMEVLKEEYKNCYKWWVLFKAIETKAGFKRHKGRKLHKPLWYKEHWSWKPNAGAVRLVAGQMFCSEQIVSELLQSYRMLKILCICGKCIQYGVGGETLFEAFRSLCEKCLSQRGRHDCYALPNTLDPILSSCDKKTFILVSSNFHDTNISETFISQPYHFLLPPIILLFRTLLFPYSGIYPPCPVNRITLN